MHIYQQREVVILNRGKIQIVDGKYLRIVTIINGEETIDRFTIDEVIEEIGNNILAKCRVMPKFREWLSKRKIEPLRSITIDLTGNTPSIYFHGDISLIMAELEEVSFLPLDINLSTEESNEAPASTKGAYL